MPEAKILGKGTRRRIARIKWKRWEIAHAIILFLLLAIFSDRLDFEGVLARRKSGRNPLSQGP